MDKIYEDWLGFIQIDEDWFRFMKIKTESKKIPACTETPKRRGSSSGDMENEEIPAFTETSSAQARI